MQVRNFVTIAVKNTPENLEHANSIGYKIECSKALIKIEVPQNAYQFAANQSKLKKALGF